MALQRGMRSPSETLYSPGNMLSHLSTFFKICNVDVSICIALYRWTPLVRCIITTFKQRFKGNDSLPCTVLFQLMYCSLSKKGYVVCKYLAIKAFSDIHILTQCSYYYVYLQHGGVYDNDVNAPATSEVLWTLWHCLCCCRKEKTNDEGEMIPKDLGGGYASSDGGFIRRCGCFFCGIDLRRWLTTKKTKSRRNTSDLPARQDKSDVVLPLRGTAPVTQQLLGGPSRTGSALKHPLKAGCARRRRKDGAHRRPADRRRRPVSGGPRESGETAASLSHYFRRHRHRARDHSRAMRQVAEWIQSAGPVAEDDALTGHRRHGRRHTHEHHHHHYHYHYSVRGII